MSKFLSISSKDKSRGTIEDFVLKLDNPIENLKGVRSMQISLPYSWYTVMSGINDKIYFKVGVTTYTATLTEGNYTGGSLGTFLTEVQTQINAAYTPDNLYTVALSSLTEKITITHPSASTSMVFGTNTTASARRLLGFDAVDLAAGLTQTGQNVYSLTWDDTIFVKSRALAGGKSYIANERTSIIIPIPVTGTFGDTIVYRSQGEQWDIIYSDHLGKTLTEIDFTLLFEDNSTVVPLNGLDWRISFRYAESVKK